MNHVSAITSKKSSQCSSSWIISSVFYMKVLWFSILHLSSWSILSFFLFVLSVRLRFKFFGGAYGYSIALVPYAKKAIFPPLNCFYDFVKIKWVYWGGSISGFFVLFHWSMCLPILHSPDYCSSIRSLKIWWTNSSHFIFLCQNSFSYSSSFAFLYKF